MSGVRFELDIGGLNEIMKSGAMASVLEDAGAAVAAASGIQCGVRTHTASFVAIANVYPDTKEAAKANYKTNALMKGAEALK